MFRNIIFFRYKLLSEQLRNDDVDEFLAVKYMIIGTVIAGGAISIPIEFVPGFFQYTKENFALSIFEFLVAAIINIVGIWYLYHANCQGDGKDFFKRIICLNLPVLLSVVIIYGIPGYFLLEIITIQDPLPNRISELPPLRGLPLIPSILSIIRLP